MSIRLVADRMENIPFAGIRKVVDKALKLEAEGVHVIRFEVGRPDFDTPAHIKSAAKKALDQGMVHYAPNAGIPALREAIAASIHEYKGIGYDPATEIMVTAGGQGASSLSLHAFLNPGDEVLVPDPGFAQFFTCIRLAGGVPVFMPLDADNDFVPDLEQLTGLLTDRTKAIIVNSPHNPTGTVLTAKQIEEIRAFAKKHDLLVFSDEAYDRILFEDSDFMSPAAVPGMKEQTCIWGSLSKTYAMTGWRIGYLAAPAELLDGAVRVQQNLMLSLCAFAQAGAVAAINGPQDCVDEMVAAFDERRKIIMEGIDRAPGLSCTAIPTGAFYVYVKHDIPGMDSETLTDRLLEEAGVALVPGNAFGNGGEDYFRISFAVSSDNCREGMDRIVKFMAAFC